MDKPFVDSNATLNSSDFCSVAVGKSTTIACMAGNGYRRKAKYTGIIQVEMNKLDDRYKPFFVVLLFHETIEEYIPPENDKIVGYE